MGGFPGAAHGRYGSPLPMPRLEPLMQQLSYPHWQGGGGSRFLDESLGAARRQRPRWDSQPVATDLHPGVCGYGHKR